MLLPYAKYIATRDIFPAVRRFRIVADVTDNRSALRLRYEHTLRSVDRHAAVLGELRGRASIVLSASGIIASLFGARVLSEKTPLWISIVALVWLGLGLLACLVVLAPAPDRSRRSWLLAGRRRPRRWKVTLSAGELERATSGGTEETALQNIIDLLTPARKVNYQTLERRTFAFNVACVALVVQIGFWAIALLVYRR
jgi:hypothetical protein